MRIFGFNVTRTKSSVPVTDLTPFVDGRGGWYPVVTAEPFPGAWQRNMEQRAETVMAFHAVYSCVTLIAEDVSKCRIMLVEEDEAGIWNEVAVAAFSPVLRKPNHYQNRIQFYQNWVTSKLMRGNTYVLKGRDSRGVVTALYVLHPDRCRPLVAPNGDVYYQTKSDNLAGVEGDIAIPASEIIHDVMAPLYHPLCGVSPLMASGVAAMQGMAIQGNSARFFENASMPGGVLTAPGTIDDVTAKRFKDEWEKKFTGNNVGRVAVLGDGLKYEQMAVTATEAQLVEQLQWSAKVVCSTFKMPPYKVGVGDAPPHLNIEAQEQQYYSGCLQKIIECIELLLDEGLGLVDVAGHTYGTEFDLDGLLRMDTATMIEAEAKAVGAGIKSPNEARQRLNLPKKPGGDALYLQQQNFSTEALAKRDAQADPFASKSPTAAPQPPTPKLAEADASDLAAITQMAAWAAREELERPQAS